VDVKQQVLYRRAQQLRDRLETGWGYVRPGGSHANNDRYLARFLDLLRQYEEAEDLLLVAPDAGRYSEELWAQYARNHA